MSDREFMNISELCRVCMNSGSFLLSDQQLEMLDGEEINCLDMLREFSANEVFIQIILELN